ncbi:hypothetical protein Hanom_Chr02g00172051 [Helianthus anomalus]
MNDLANCREFYSLSLPPAERMFQKNRHRMDLLDDHIHAGVNFYATCQEIVREWQLMGDDTLEFEADKKELAEEMEKFNAGKKGVLWRVSDVEDKLAKKSSLMPTCRRNGRPPVSGLTTKRSDEHEQERALYQKRESEYIQRIARLEKIASGKAAESAASEVLAEKAAADCKWLLARGVPLVHFLFYGEGRAAAVANEKVDHFDLHKTDCEARYAEKCQEYKFLKFAIVKAVGKLSRKTNGVKMLKKPLGDQDPKAGDAGPSHQG